MNRKAEQKNSPAGTTDSAVPAGLFLLPNFSGAQTPDYSHPVPPVFLNNCVFIGGCFCL
jgi:hypothetical protein